MGNQFALNDFFEKLKELSIERKAMPLKEEKLQFILKNLPKNKELVYLEVGGGVGYSFLRIASSINIAKAFLFEKDPLNCKLIKENIKNFEEMTKKKLNYQIFCGDAVETLKLFKEKADFSLVDANKSKYLEYYLILKGKAKLLFFDNSFFSLEGERETDKRYKTIRKKLKEFHDFLIKDKDVLEIIHFKVYDGITKVLFKDL